MLVTRIGSATAGSRRLLAGCPLGRPGQTRGRRPRRSQDAAAAKETARQYVRAEDALRHHEVRGEDGGLQKRARSRLPTCEPSTRATPAVSTALAVRRDRMGPEEERIERDGEGSVGAGDGPRSRQTQRQSRKEAKMRQHGFARSRFGWPCSRCCTVQQQATPAQPPRRGARRSASRPAAAGGRGHSDALRAGLLLQLGERLADRGDRHSGAAAQDQLHPGPARQGLRHGEHLRRDAGSGSAASARHHPAGQRRGHGAGGRHLPHRAAGRCHAAADQPRSQPAVHPRTTSRSR